MKTIFKILIAVSYFYFVIFICCFPELINKWILLAMQITVLYVFFDKSTDLVDDYYNNKSKKSDKKKFDDFDIEKFKKAFYEYKNSINDTPQSPK